MQRVTCWEWWLWPLSAAMAKCQRKWLRGIADVISYTILLPWAIVGVFIAAIAGLSCGIALVVCKWWDDV